MSVNAKNFVGHEASCRGFSPLFKILDSRGIDTHSLLEGTSLTCEQVCQLARRIDWADFHRVMKNIGNTVGESGIRNAGRDLVRSPSHMFAAIVGRVFLSTGEYYAWTSKVLEQEFVPFKTHVVHLDDCRTILDFRLEDEYEPSREFFILLSGMYSVNLTRIGFPDTEVNMEWLRNGARYDLKYTPGGGRLGWLGKRVMWLWTARHAASALKDYDNILDKHYVELLDETRARKEAEEALDRVAADERRRIRQDLHDGVGQELTGLSFLMRRVAQSKNGEAIHDSEAIETVVKGIERAIGQVQNAIEGLNPVSDSGHGLMDALDEMASRSATRSGIQCIYLCPEPVRVEDLSVATHLFHIAQEAVANAIKHAEANHIEVHLERKNGLIMLSVKDDGVGLERGVSPGTRIGMEIMRHRAQSIGASLNIESPAEGGTLLACTLATIQGDGDDNE